MPLDVGDFAHTNFSLFHGILKEGTLYKFGTKYICKGNPVSGGGRSSALFPYVQAERLILSSANLSKQETL